MAEIKVEVLKQMYHDLNRIEKLEFADWVTKKIASELITRIKSNASN